MIYFRSGLCGIDSSDGARERIGTISNVASLVEVGVLIEEAGGRDVVLESERRWRNSMDLLRSVMTSRLTILGHSLLRCLWVGRVYGAFMGKSCEAIVRPSASRSGMASAAAITCKRVLRSIFARGV